MNIDKIISYFNDGKIKWSTHGLARMQERGITINDIKVVMAKGK